MTPVGDNARAILDGRLFLNRRLAGRGIYPAIDPQLSVSRLLVDLASPEEYQLAMDAREIWGEYDACAISSKLVRMHRLIHELIVRYPYSRPCCHLLKQSLGEHQSRALTIGRWLNYLVNPFQNQWHSSWQRVC